MKIPVMLIVGKKEVKAGKVSARDREGDKGSMGLEEVIKNIAEQINGKK